MKFHCIVCACVFFSFPFAHCRQSDGAKRIFQHFIYALHLCLCSLRTLFYVPHWHGNGHKVQKTKRKEKKTKINNIFIYLAVSAAQIWCTPNPFSIVIQIWVADCRTAEPIRHAKSTLLAKNLLQTHFFFIHSSQCSHGVRFGQAALFDMTVSSLWHFVEKTTNLFIELVATSCKWEKSRYINFIM